MRRKRDNMVLYEAVRKATKKVPTDTKSGWPHMEKLTRKGKHEKDAQEKNADSEQKMPNWPPKRSPAKVLSQKKVFKVPVAVIAAISVVLVLLVVVKIVQVAGNDDTQVPEPGVSGTQDTPVVDQEPMAEVETPVVETEDAPAVEAEETIEVLKPIGDHVIIIASIEGRSEHLEPVKDYFADNGVGCEIERRGIYYMLVTKGRFESPKRAGSTGYKELQKIKSIGLKYKAPKGYESFAPNLFQDAYGEKVR